MKDFLNSKISSEDIRELLMMIVIALMTLEEHFFRREQEEDLICNLLSLMTAECCLHQK